MISLFGYYHSLSLELFSMILFVKKSHSIARLTSNPVILMPQFPKPQFTGIIAWTTIPRSFWWFLKFFNCFSKSDHNHFCLTGFYFVPHTSRNFSQAYWCKPIFLAFRTKGSRVCGHPRCVCVDIYIYIHMYISLYVERYIYICICV